MKTLSLITATLLFFGMAVSLDGTALQPTYIGSDACIGCHANFPPNLVAEYQKTGHPYKLNEVMGDASPMYPMGTTPGVELPPGTSWSDFKYVIGGYGWKARFVQPDGRIYTAGDSAQYNLPDPGLFGSAGMLGRDASYAPYHPGEERLYNFSCFQCHTTGASSEGSWNGVPADSLGTFNEPGIRCEGCHGPGSEHQVNPTGVSPPNQGDVLRITRCGDCHQRGGTTNAIPASGGYIRHHEQLNEMRASKHGDGMNFDLTCASCHNPHVPVRYASAAGAGQEGITTECQSCHGGQVVQGTAMQTLDCVDCHMSRASKSATGVQLGNGWQGDVKTHIWAINSNPVTKTEAMFTPDGSQVALDANGLAAVTLDFACLACHTDKDVQWASGFAQAVHTTGIFTGEDETAEVPSQFALEQNYPNPFNPTTQITFALPEASDVSIRVFDATGRLVGTVVENYMPAGNHSATIDAGSLPSGVYFYEMKAGDYSATKSMVLTK